MDLTLSKIIRGFGFFRSEYDTQDVNYDHATHKFVVNKVLTDEERKKATQNIVAALRAVNFNFDSAAFQKLEQAKGPDYWVFAVRVPIPFSDRNLDRDESGNLIFSRTKRRVFGG